MAIPILAEKKLSKIDGKVCVCGKCHHKNIATARFCGCCGAALSKNNLKTDEGIVVVSKNFDSAKKLETQNEAKPKPKKSLYKINFNNSLLKLRLKLQSEYKKYFSVDTAYRVVIMTAVMLIVFSGAVSYAFFYNTNIVRVSAKPFSDVALDHPIYSVCPNLIKINAIGFRQANKLEPYEDISAAEWNYAVNCMTSHYGMDYFKRLILPEDKPISIDELRKKVVSLGFSGSQLTNIKRFTAFKCLEETLVEAGCVII